ncbi:MAG: phosphoribosyl-ATP diphosphatase [Proteobacteria bacterium]|nr:phosphoribosyl-ATP diphosphatase [Pseudomonadota bacterium]
MAKGADKGKKRPKAKASAKAKAGVAKKAKAKRGLKSKGKTKRREPAPPPGLGTEVEGVLERLFAVIESRRSADPEVSNTARLFKRGTAKIAQKLGEEAVEAVIAAARKDRDGVVNESADVLYHLLVMWADAGVAPGDVLRELERREGISGIAEKKARLEALAAAEG